MSGARGGAAFGPSRNQAAAALLLLTLLLPAATAQEPAAPADEARRVECLAKVFDSGDYDELSRAARGLSRPKSERAAKFLLKRLKRNLSKKRGNYQPPWSGEMGGMFVWGSKASENSMLVGALTEQGYAAAVPTLREMLKMKWERTGVGAANLAYCINKLTGETVEYEEWGVKKTFPAPAPKP